MPKPKFTLKDALPDDSVLLEGYDVPYVLRRDGTITKPAHTDGAGNSRRGITLKPQFPLGRAVVRLLKDGQRVAFSLSHLVAENFVEKAEGRRRFVRHIDGDIRNCAAWNLELHDYRELAAQATALTLEPIVLYVPKVGEQEYPSISEASRSTGVSIAAIGKMLRRGEPRRKSYRGRQVMWAKYS